MFFSSKNFFIFSRISFIFVEIRENSQIIVRISSLVLRSNRAVFGMFWRFLDRRKGFCYNYIL